MAVLTTKARDKLPSKVFGLPGKRAYPMENKAHAVNAKARAKQELNKGKLSQGQYEQIIGMANHVIAKSQSNG